MLQTMLQTHDWSMFLMLGSIALLAVSVILKVSSKNAPLAPEADLDLRDTIGTIGQYRPRVYH